MKTIILIIFLLLYSVISIKSTKSEFLISQNEPTNNSTNEITNNSQNKVIFHNGRLLPLMLIIPIVQI
jgi:hypothetical protein